MRPERSSENSQICYGVVDRVMVDWSESIDAQWMEALTVLEQSDAR